MHTSVFYLNWGGDTHHLKLIHLHRQFQMVYTEEEMRAARQFCRGEGTRPEIVRLRAILDSLPRAPAQGSLVVQCLHHRELQICLRTLNQDYSKGVEYRFNNVVAHHPWIFGSVSY